MTAIFRSMNVLVAIAIIVTPTASFADSIGVNFSGNRTYDVSGDTQPNSNTQPLAGSAVAGVTAVAQANWNNAGFKTGSSTSLIDSNGNATAASISWNSNNTWATFGTTAQSNANKQLMNGYLDTWENITVSGITYGTYDVYVYIGSDQNDRIGHGYLVTGNGTSSSVYFKTYSVGFDGSTWTAATGTYATSTTSNSVTTWSTDANEAQYIVFHGVTGSSFTYYEAHDSNNVGVCAIQIVSTVPEPASTVLMLMGVGGLTVYTVWRRRSNKKDTDLSADGGILISPPRHR